MAVSAMTYRLPPDHLPIALPKYLRGELGFSARLYKKIKYSGRFYRNGQLIERPAALLLQPGDVIDWELAYDPITAEPLPLDIRYEDGDLLIVNKPAGELVHPTSKVPSGTLANGISFYYETRGIKAAFHPVQRLDGQTSGLTVIAKSPQVHRFLGGLAHDCFWREYLAVCEGLPSPAVGTISAPIARKAGSIIQREVSEAGKSAVTHYRVLRTDGRLSLLALHLGTGRTHQIRVHLAHTGHPLAGDDLYGGSRTYIQRQALHAFGVSLPHPATGQRIYVVAPLPRDMLDLCDRISR